MALFAAFRISPTWKLIAAVAFVQLMSNLANAEDRIAVPPDLSSATVISSGHWIAYGERADMDAEVVVKRGLDTAHAMVTTKPSFRSAIRRCAFESSEEVSVARSCAVKALAYAPPKFTLHANCANGEFESRVVVRGGNRMRFLGRSKNGTDYFESMSDLNYLPNPTYKEVTGYDMVQTAWRALCPQTGRKHILSVGELVKIEKRLQIK